MHILKKPILLLVIMLSVSLAMALELDPSLLRKHPQWVQDVVSDLDKQVAKYALPGGIIGISLKDLITGETFSVNGRQPFNPASVIKIPVMVEAFHQIDEGELSMDDLLTLRFHNKIPGAGSIQYAREGSRFTVRKLVEEMITNSDNTATNMLIEKLGMYSINAYMNKIGMRRTVIKDPTMLCKKPGRFNLTTPEDMLLVMDKIYRGQVISQKASAEMLEIMKRQHHKWGIARFLPRDVIIANKTGSLDFVRNDVGIIMGERPYILSIFCRNLPSNHFGSVLVGAMSKVIYERRLQQSASSEG
ncbi:MAG: serine hydrolase [Candidatus Margulisiibacteriota bacterium]